MILSVESSDTQAGQAALMGVWAADDLADRQGAKDGGSTERPGEGETVEAARAAATRCRRLAIACLEADRMRGLTFTADEATADALLAALHRRVGDLDAACAFARAGMAREPVQVLRSPHPGPTACSSGVAAKAARLKPKHEARRDRSLQHFLRVS